MTDQELHLLSVIQQRQEPDGYARSLFQIAVEAEQPYNRAWFRLVRMQRDGRVDVVRSRPGRPLLIRVRGE